MGLLRAKSRLDEVDCDVRSSSEADVHEEGIYVCLVPEASIRKGTALYTKGANFCLVEAEEMTL